MVKSESIRVSKNFKNYMQQLRMGLLKSNGKDYSTVELTEILAQFRPSISIEQRRKRKTIFDF